MLISIEFNLAKHILSLCVDILILYVFSHTVQEKSHHQDDTRSEEAHTRTIKLVGLICIYVFRLFIALHVTIYLRITFS